MTRNAEKHLAAAKEYVAKGDEYGAKHDAFYRKAAEEIVAALEADPTLTQLAVAERLGKGRTWVSDLVRWQTGKSAVADSSAPFSGGNERADRSAAKKVLRQSSPEQIAEIVADSAIRRNVAAALQIAARNSELPRYIDTPRSDPSFISLVVRINSALIELESAVKSWANPSAIPVEFSAASFDDISEKAMRIKDTVNALRSADNDEFQDIVRNFRLVPS